MKKVMLYGDTYVSLSLKGFHFTSRVVAHGIDESFTGVAQVIGNQLVISTNDVVREHVIKATGDAIRIEYGIQTFKFPSTKNKYVRRLP